MASYGFGGGGYGAQETALKEALSTTAQQRRNRQLQAPYAAENGMAQAQASTPTQEEPAPPPTPVGQATSPVTPEGQIQPSPPIYEQGGVTGQTYTVDQPAAAPAAGTTTIHTTGPTTNATGTLPQAPIAGTSPYGPYPARPANTNWTSDLSGIPQDVAAYGGQDLGTQTTPDMSTINDLEMQALMKVLGGSPLDTEAMKARLREDALGMAEQQARMVDQNAASRGTFGGGWQGGVKNDITQAALSNILGGYRDVDIEAANRALQDRLAGVNAAGQVAAGQFGRGLQAGQFEREGMQGKADEAYRAWATQLPTAQFALQKALAANDLTKQEAAMNQANYGADIDAFFNQKGLDYQSAISAAANEAAYKRAQLQALMQALGLAQESWDSEAQRGLLTAQLGSNTLAGLLSGLS